MERSGTRNPQVSVFLTIINALFLIIFSVLVGCGLESIHLFHEALSRQTKHVQFVVFEREDKNLEQPVQILRDVNSFFLLAYFFPNCDNEDQSKGKS